MLDGQQTEKFKGADEKKFSSSLAVLLSALSGKAYEHMGMKFT